MCYRFFPRMCPCVKVPTPRTDNITPFGKMIQPCLPLEAQRGNLPPGVCTHRDTQKKSNHLSRMLSGPGESQPQDVPTHLGTACFYFQVLLCVFFPCQRQAKTYFLFQITAAIISSGPAPGKRMCFLPLLVPHTGA